ncbi:hypothetical protein TTMY_0889 [Thermus thermophilus]|nr:hypothetical protein TTMY_0889 [Thermus thermophilus]
MAQNRKHWKEVLAQLEARIEEHWRKIREEEARPQPNWGVIAHWEREIRSWERRRERILRRLGRRS